MRANCMLDRARGKSNDTEGRLICAWAAGFPIDGDPDFKGRLRCQIMEAKRREQADDAFRYSFGGHRKTMVRRCVCGGRHVQASPHARNQPFFACQPKVLARYFVGIQITGSQNSGSTGHFFNNAALGHRGLFYKTSAINNKRRHFVKPVSRAWPRLVPLYFPDARPQSRWGSNPRRPAWEAGSHSMRPHLVSSMRNHNIRPQTSHLRFIDWRF